MAEFNVKKFLKDNYGLGGSQGTLEEIIASILTEAVVAAAKAQTEPLVEAITEEMRQASDVQRRTNTLLEQLIQKEYPETKFPEVQGVRVMNYPESVTIENPLEVVRPEWLDALKPDLSPLLSTFEMTNALLAELCQNQQVEQKEESQEPTDKAPTTVRVPAKNNINVYPLTGTVDGTNADFFLPFAPKPGHLILMRNNIPQKLNSDYTLSGNKVSYTNPFQTDEDHWAWMIK